MQTSFSGASQSFHSVCSESSSHASHSGDPENGIELSQLSIAGALTSQVVPSREGSMLAAAQIDGMSRLEALPDEVRTQVLDLLDVRSLINVSSTSRTLLTTARTILNARASDATGFSYDQMNQAAQSLLKEFTDIRTQLRSLGDESTILDRMGEGTANCLTSVTKLITLSLLAPFVCCCPCLVCCCCCAILGNDDRVELNNAMTKVDFLVASRAVPTTRALEQLNKNIANWNRKHPAQAIELSSLERSAHVSHRAAPQMLLGFDLSQLPDAVKPKMKVADYRTSFERLLVTLRREDRNTRALQGRLLAL